MSGEQSTYQTVKDAAASAAEQVRSAAPGIYDASTRAGRYVGDVTSEHPIPVLLAAVATAFFAGYSSRPREDHRTGWERRARDWQKRGSELGARAREAVPDASRAAADAGQYVASTVREHPYGVIGTLGAIGIGWMLASLLRTRD